MLAVPALANERRLAWSPSSERVPIPQAEWGPQLDAFTKRNVGRIAALEVDDPEMGAQAQEHDYPFLGVTWDHNDRRVDVMLGDFKGVRRHLTRGIAGVTAIDMLQDEKGRDWVLRIAHGRGQTILQFTR